jgi:hypothetical protein
MNPEDARTEADFISPSPDLTGHKDAVMTYASAILDEHGLSSSVVTGTNQTFTSALDRIIANSDIQDLIEDNQEMYSEVEKAAYKIIGAQLRSINSNIELPPDELVVVYPKPKVLVSDSEILDNMKKMKELGIFQDWELLQVFDPNLDQDEAQEKIAEIKAGKMKMINELDAESDAESDAEEVETETPENQDAAIGNV